MTRWFKIPDWRKFVKYKDRHPTWICLHVDLLDDLCFEELSEAERWQVAAIWLLAARYDDPKTPGYEDGPALRYDPDWIKSKAGLRSLPNLERFESLSIIVPSEPVTNSLRNRNSETETKTYAKTEGKGDADGSPPPGVPTEPQLQMLHEMAADKSVDLEKVARSLSRWPISRKDVTPLKEHLLGLVVPSRPGEVGMSDAELTDFMNENPM